MSEKQSKTQEQRRKETCRDLTLVYVHISTETPWNDRHVLTTVVSLSTIPNIQGNICTVYLLWCYSDGLPHISTHCHALRVLCSFSRCLSKLQTASLQFHHLILQAPRSVPSTKPLSSALVILLLVTPIQHRCPSSIHQTPHTDNTHTSVFQHHI